MSKRTVVLIIILAVLWVAVIFYYFGGFIRKSTRPVKTTKPSVLSHNTIKITPEFLKKYKMFTEQSVKSVDFTTPFFTSKGEEFFRSLIIENRNTLKSIKFAGYIISKGKGYIFLDFGGSVRKYSINEMILDRYIIVYTSSIGIVVLDSKEGGLYVIK